MKLSHTTLVDVILLLTMGVISQTSNLVMFSNLHFLLILALLLDPHFPTLSAHFMSLRAELREGIFSRVLGTL